MPRCSILSQLSCKLAAAAHCIEMASSDILASLDRLPVQGPDLPASLVALFTFVAKDSTTMKATEVNPLQPTSDEEREAFRQRQELADARKAARKRGSDGTPGKLHLGAAPPGAIGAESCFPAAAKKRPAA